MGVGQLSESDAVDALRLPFYSSSHPTGSHGWRNQFDLGNTSIILVQYSFGVLHYAYLSVVFRRNHLSSFAMWAAFPPSDYYEDSVTIGVSPRRPSRVPLTLGVWLG